MNYLAQEITLNLGKQLENIAIMQKFTSFLIVQGFNGDSPIVMH